MTGIVRSSVFWSAENFFAYDDFAAHELGFYYLVSLRQPLPFHESDIVHRVLDGVEVEFRWLPAQPSALLKSDLRPRFIAERIEALPHGMSILSSAKDVPMRLKFPRR